VGHGAAQTLRAVVASWEYAFAMGHGCSIGGHPDHRAIRHRSDLRAQIAELTDYRWRASSPDTRAAVAVRAILATGSPGARLAISR
jgi:hypothetical protein